MSNNHLHRKREFKDAIFGQLARIGGAVSAPKRIELLDLLAQTKRTVESLAAETAMSVANTSRHLQVLEGARLVRSRREGRFVYYSLAGASVADFYRALRAAGEDRLPEMDKIRNEFLPRAELSQTEARALAKQVRLAKAIIVDVRPEEEYRTAHIASAISMPVEDLKNRLSDLPRNKKIVVYCRGPYCSFAVDAVRLLRARGFRADRLETSVHDWHALGLPIAMGERRR